MTSRPLIFLGIVIIIIAAVAAVGYVLKKDATIDTLTIIEPIATTSPIIIEPTPIPTATTSLSFVIPYPASSTADTSSWQIYVDKEGGYSIEHPSNLIRNNSAGILTLVFPKSTYFRWPLLDDAKVTMTVSATCPAVIAGGKNGKATVTELDLNGVHFTRSVGMDVAAGNRYLEIAYDTKSKGNCYHLSFFNHGANGAGLYVDSASLSKKYDAEHEADLAKVIDILGGMVKTLRILAPASEM